MRELSYFRPSYFVRRGHTVDECPVAHRIVRNALAIGDVLASIPSRAVIDAMSAVERAEPSGEDARVIPARDAATLASALTSVGAALGAGVSEDLRPKGAVGQQIEEEARRPRSFEDGTPDYDRVFELREDGRVGLIYPRISLPELFDRLPDVACVSTTSRRRWDGWSSKNDRIYS